MAERIKSERWEEEAISDLAGLAMGDRGSRMVAAAEEEKEQEEEEELALVEEIDDTSPTEMQEGGWSRSRAKAGGAKRRKTRIPSSWPQTSPKSATESSSDDDDDRPRIVPLYRAKHPAKAKDAAAPKSSLVRAAASAAPVAGAESPSKALRTAQQQGVGDSLAELALQARAAQGLASAAEPAAGNHLAAHPAAVGASVASHKRAWRLNGIDDQQEPTKRARQRPDAFVAEPASGKIRQDDAAKNESAARTSQRTAKPTQLLRPTDESALTLAVLKNEYIQIVGRAATGRCARDPGWLRAKIAEKKNDLAKATARPSTHVPALAAPVLAPGNANGSKPGSSTLASVPATTAAKPAEPKEMREMRDWLFVRQLGSIADALINEGFESLKHLIEGELTQKEVEDECFKFNMYARKRLLRELEYETKLRSIAVAVGSPPISRPEEHTETVANGTAAPATTALSAAEKDEEPDAEDILLSDEDRSSDEDDDKNIYDPAESIASCMSRPDNTECARSPGQSRIRRPAASSTKGNQLILKDDTGDKNVHNPAKQISSPTQSPRLKNEKKRTRSPDDYTSRRPALSPTTTEKQPRTSRKLPPLTLRKIVPGGLERPTPATWEQVASTDLFCTFWELSVHDLDPELPSTPRGEKRVSLRKDSLISSFSAKSTDWVLDTSPQRFVKMFLDHCIFPRVRQSKAAKDDARYCCEFVSKMQQVKTPRFNLVVYVDALVKSFPGIIQKADGEAQMLSLIELLCETLCRVSRWRTCAAAFMEECCSPTCNTTHEKFVELSSKWHSQLATVLIKELAPTSTEQQNHAPKHCYMIALHKLLQWLTLTPQQHEVLNKYLQHLEKTGSGTSITLAIKLRQQLPPPQNFDKKLVAAESKHQGLETSNHLKPGSEPHSTLVSRLASFYTKEYPDHTRVAVDEFLAAFYRQDPRAKSEMDVLRGSYPQPARFLAEACGGVFEVTNHGLQCHVGLAQARATKPITALQRRLITAFWWSFGTQETSGHAFLRAIQRHDPAVRKLLPSKPMVYLMQDCCNILHVQDCGSGHYKLRLRSEAIEEHRILCNPTDECMRNREAPAVRSGPNSAHSKQPAATPSAGISIRAPKVEPEDMRIGAAAAKQMSQVDRQKAIDAALAKHKAAKKSATGQSATTSTIRAAPTKKISRPASQKSTVAKPKAAKKVETIVDLTSMPDEFENVSESLGDSTTASPIPDGALIGTASIEQDENWISGMAGGNGARMAVTSYSDVTRDPRRREPTVTAPAQDRHRQRTQQPGLTKQMHSQPLHRPPSQAQTQHEQLLLELGPKPDTPAFRLFLYKRQEKPHELSWICFEEGMHGRNGFPVPPELVAHIEQVIRIAAVKELQTLPSRRIWSSGPRGGREWPKMRSHLLSSAGSTQPNKVVVCSPRLADRLFQTDTATRYKGHYYLSGDRLYHDEYGRIKAQYFK